MAHKRIDPTSLEYLAYEDARKEYRAAAQYLYKLRLHLPSEAQRTSTQNAAWAIFIQKYRAIAKRFFEAKQALIASLAEPVKSPDLDLLAATLNLSAPLPNIEIEKEKLKEENLRVIEATPELAAIMRAAQGRSKAPLDFSKEPENAKELVDEGLGVKAFTNDPALEEEASE